MIRFSVIALRIPGGEGRAGAELLGLSSPRAPSEPPEQPSPRWLQAEAPWGWAGGAGPALGPGECGMV